MKKFTITLLLIPVLWFPAHPGTPVNTPDEVESACNLSSGTHLDFAQINEINYYVNKEQLDILRNYKGDDESRYLAMMQYVGQFGPVNFKNDSRLIWATAKLAHSLGYLEDAVSLYKLVLRHHKADIEFSELMKVSDSLNRLENNRYVSLDYYYSLTEHSHQADKVIEPHSLALNLGDKINSHGPDYAPAFHAGSQSLIFTSQRGHNGFGHDKTSESIYISTRDRNGNWSKSKELEGISTQYNEGSGCLGHDGKTLYFSRCNSPDSYGNCDLFVAYLQPDSTWGKVENLGPDINSAQWDSHPTLSHSGDTLYFSSDRPGGFGMTDIYYTYKNKLGKWVKPRNMGPVINTKNHDLSPFYHPEYEVLYYSSNGQPNSFGQFDIYKASKKCNHAWNDPVNAGPHVNHKGSEMYFTIDPGTNLLFFARSGNHDLSKQDLYSFPLPMEAHPASNVKLKGTLMDSLTNEPIDGIVSIIDVDSGIEVAPKYTDKDGGFEFNLIKDKNYLLVVRGHDFFRVETPIYLNGPANITSKVEKIGETIMFSSINFDFDSAAVKASMHDDLNKVIKFLFDNPGYVLRIEGHTDSEGSEEYNIDLSHRRARSIRDYIILAGIDPQKVYYEGFGNKRQLIEEKTSEDRFKNRRVEFHIFNPNPDTDAIHYTTLSKL